MAEKQEIWIYFMMDADGDYAAGLSEDEVEKNFEDRIGAPTLPVRITRIKVRMAIPEVEEGFTIDIPDAAGETMQVEAEDAE